MRQQKKEVTTGSETQKTQGNTTLKINKTLKLDHDRETEGTMATQYINAVWTKAASGVASHNS